MQLFSKGQRWISDTEPDLGLGTIIDENNRQITVVFLASGETRIYAKETAPLTRIQFAVNDTIVTHDERELVITNVVEEDGCLRYQGQRDDGTTEVVSESELNNFLKFNRPQDRLFAGQIDNRKWFNLRSDVFVHRFDSAQSITRGLVGARVSIIPHQIYIANEVSSRQAPRVLLADEVGLGKTIEAGLILHSQITNHQIDRVLVVVPESLLHQWLVEMLRRFNLHFHIMDKDTFESQIPSAPDGNPFMSEQLVLCSLDSLLADPLMQTLAVDGQWDSLIVDEAHHLEWSADSPSDAYQLIEKIATTTPSTLLLTATPEQLGLQGHFARLKLLDPDRFSNYEHFQHEDEAFTKTAGIANALLSESGLEETVITQLDDLLAEDLTDSERSMLGLAAAMDLAGLRERLLTELIDRHGTSRILFRNTRSAISGFPDRALFHHNPWDESGSSPTTEDYTQWLGELLKEHYPEKVLVIVSATETVLALADSLRLAGINSAQFHEGMSIIERDRAAAWFADTEDGCQVLVCSEIGSEGRNFQFLHHLVTWELPVSPDLLEQRIGRLDRIGQKHDIQIHVPAATGSTDHKLMRWYHEGLNAFESICHIGTAVAAEVAEQLQQVLDVKPQDDSNLEALISHSQQMATELNARLEQGRDRLLELNSNRTSLISEHLDQLSREDRSYRLSDFMSRVFDSFGVDYEEQTNQSWILTPGDHMAVANFPGLDQDGLTVTFNRELALEREDFTFLSWDHPMVAASMDLVLNEAYGQANAEIINTDLLPRGVLYLEVVVTWRCVADKNLNIQRYFPTALNRLLLGSNRKDYTAVMPELNLDSMLKRSEKNRIRPFLQKSRNDINVLLRHSEKLAQNGIPGIIDEATQNIIQELDPEIARLEALKQINPAVREDEIELLRAKKQSLIEALQHTEYELVAISVLLNL